MFPECFIATLVATAFPFLFLLMCSFVSSKSCTCSEALTTAIPTTYVVPDIGVCALDVVFEVGVAEEVLRTAFERTLERSRVGM